MTLEQIRTEMAHIREIRKTDPKWADELYDSLAERLRIHIANNNLPSIWEKILLEEIQDF